MGKAKRCINTRHLGYGILTVVALTNLYLLVDTMLSNSNESKLGQDLHQMANKHLPVDSTAKLIVNRLSGNTVKRHGVLVSQQFYANSVGVAINAEQIFNSLHIKWLCLVYSIIN